MKADAYSARTLRLPSGLLFEYVERGPRGGLPVLMLHGITDTWRSFEPVLPHLPAHWHVVALSQRGHGGSQAGWSWRASDFARDAAELIETLGLTPAVVVGHSMGAANAMRLAIDRPELVRALVGAGAFASFGDKAGLVEFVGNDVAPLGNAVPHALAESFQRDTVANPLPPGLLELMVDECLRTPAAVWRAAFAGMMEDDFSAEVQRIRAPTLLVWGDADAFVPEADQQRLAAQIAGAQRSVYRGVGHALHWEQPQRFAADLVRFVEALAQVRAAA